jgi:predicted nucleic acid-binding protein
VILVDTSAWVDYLRSADTVARTELRRLFTDRPGEVVCTEPVAMELLAGARDELQHLRLQRLVDGLPSLPVDPALDFRAAADLFRLARRAGRPVRSLQDCLIASVALRHEVTLVHKDVDYEVLGELSALDQRSWR